MNKLNKVTSDKVKIEIALMISEDIKKERKSFFVIGLLTVSILLTLMNY